MSSSETYMLNVLAQAEVRGMDKAEAAMRSLQEQSEVLNRTGLITEKSLNKLSRAFEGVKDATLGTGGGVKKQLSSFQELQKEIQKVSRSLNELAKQQVSPGGSTTPQKAVSSTMTSDRARQIIAANEAESVTALSTARAVVKAEDEKTKAATRTAAEKTRLAQEQDKVYNKYLEDQYKADQRNSSEKNKLAQEQDKVYNKYLEDQYKAEQKAAANTSKIEKQKNDAAHKALVERAVMQEAAQRKSREAELRDLRAGILSRDASATRRGGRGYDNTSVQLDSAIAQRSKESSDFAKRLKADMEERVRAENKAAKATEKSTQVNMKSDMSIRQLAQSNGGLRYALYDVSRTAGLVTAAIAGIGIAAVVTAASFETAFTQVERTTMASEAELQKVYKGLMQITQDTPQSWAFVNEVASIGAQLNIATDSLTMFTEQTTRFSSVTGITAEASAMAFGSLGQLLKLSAGEFESLGSAIAYVGVNSVATDQEIVTMAQRLGASAENAGLTAQEVVALSGAFASLRIAPERAQGVMEVYFKVLNSAIADGGERLDAFAKVSGMSTEAVKEMVASDPAAYFRTLSQGLGSLDPVSMTSALGDLGLSGIRAGEVFTRVSGNLEVFDKAMEDSYQAWKDGTHLSEAYGKVVDDLVSKWTIFKNALAELGATIGGNLSTPLKWLLDVVTLITQSFSTFLNHPIGKVLTWVGIGFGLLATAIAGTIAVTAIVLASLAATSFALKELGLTSVASVFTMNGVRAALSAIGVSATVSATALKAFKIALASTGIGLAVVALGTLAAAFMNVEHPANAAAASFEKLFGDGAGLQGALTEDAKAFEAAGRQLGDSFTAITYSVEDTASSVDDYSDGMKAAADLVGVTLPAFESTTDVVDEQTRVLGANTLAWMQNALVVSEAFQKHASNEDFAADFKQLGLTMEDVLKAAAEGGEQGVYDLYARATEASGKGGELLSNWWGTFWGRLGRAATLFWETLQDQFDAIGSLDFSRLDKIKKEYSKSWDEVWGSTVYNRASTDLAKAATGIVNQASHAQEALENLDTAYNPEENVENLDDTADAAGRVADRVYTLVDYANDLASVWDRAFDIRFSGEQTLDTITTSLINIRKAAEESARKIRDLKNDIAGMSSDIKIQEYFLSIAVEYGDTKRAEAIEANLLKLRADLSDKTAELQEEQDKASMSLEGNSESAIENRKNIQQLVQQYQSHVKALAASGMEADQLALKTEELRQDFIAQATQLGYSRVEVMKYASAFDDVATAIRGVPRDITVTASADPAIQALNELRAKADAASNSISGLRNNASTPISTNIDTASAARAARLTQLQAALEQARADHARALASGADNRALESLRRVNHYTDIINSGSYANGGYTGPGGMYEAAGVVHRGEYVIPKRDVNQATGRPYADAMGRHLGGVPSRATAPTSRGSSGGPNMVSLTAGSIQALSHAVSKVLVLDGQVLAESSANQYKTGTVLGAY